jgi:hypothetical protein
MAIERHLPRDPANAQATSARLALDPLAELQRYVSIAILFFRW